MGAPGNRFRTLLSIGAALVMLGLLLGGCGGSKSSGLSKSDYMTQLSALRSELSGAISSTAGATSPQAAATAMTAAQSKLRDALTKLKAISPPDAAKVGNEQLVTAVGELIDELGPVIAKLKSGDFTALGSVTSLKGFLGIEKAASTLTKAGYDVAS
ncbi:MAG TPA: hypothetical protein VGM80_09960 [Gaiellaceae bacterium]